MMTENKTGFTLIEIMIAVAIFAILSSIMIFNFRSDAKSKDLKNDCQKITDALKQVQTMALSGRQANGVIPEGYKFVLNCSGGICGNINLEASTSPAVTFSAITLSKSEIYNLNGLNPVSLIIGFVPPSADSQIWVNGVAVVTSSIKIGIRNIQDTNLSKCVVYNSISGRMDIINSCN